MLVLVLYLLLALILAAIILCEKAYFLLSKEEEIAMTRKEWEKIAMAKRKREKIAMARRKWEKIAIARGEWKKLPADYIRILQLNRRYISEDLYGTPYYAGPLSKETDSLRKHLLRFHDFELLITSSQPFQRITIHTRAVSSIAVASTQFRTRSLRGDHRNRYQSIHGLHIRIAGPTRDLHVSLPTGAL